MFCTSLQNLKIPCIFFSEVPCSFRQKNLFVDTVLNVLMLNEIDDLSTHNLRKMCLCRHPNLSNITNKNILQATLSYICSTKHFQMRNWAVLPVIILHPSPTPKHTQTHPFSSHASLHLYVVISAYFVWHSLPSL